MKELSRREFLKGALTGFANKKAEIDPVDEQQNKRLQLLEQLQSADGVRFANLIGVVNHNADLLQFVIDTLADMKFGPENYDVEPEDGGTV